jgi:hypothetical protein
MAKQHSLLEAQLSAAVANGDEILIQTANGDYVGVPTAIDRFCLKLLCQGCDESDGIARSGVCILMLDTIDAVWFERQEWTNDRLETLMNNS